MMKLFILSLLLLGSSSAFSQTPDCSYSILTAGTHYSRELIIRTLQEKGYHLAAEGETPRFHLGIGSELVPLRRDYMVDPLVQVNVYLNFFAKDDGGQFLEGSSKYYTAWPFIGRHGLHRIAAKRALDKVPACAELVK